MSPGATSSTSCAAFLSAIDRLAQEPRTAADARSKLRVLYISPLKALAVDVAMHQTDARSAERSARLASLTEREAEVMQRVAAGKLNKVIADELHVSVRTVEVHRARVFAKLGVRSAAELATQIATG